jgi:dTDP-4-dehydrorhamnose 3,5-epimerase
MHFQYPPYAEMKLVMCLHGAVWDVAVDLRQGSPSLLRHQAVELSQDNNRALLIPEGFAHGFQALTDNVELLYLHSEPYCPRTESGLNPTDPILAICWPLEIAEISKKDARRDMLGAGFVGVAL